MKSEITHLKSYLCILFILSTLAPPCSAALQIENSAATGITRTTAYFCGNLVATNGTTNAVTAQLLYGTSDATTNRSSWTYTNTVVTLVVTGGFSTNITGLTAAQYYYYRWYALEGASNDWTAASTSFWTLAGSPTGASATVVYHPVMVDSNGDLVAPTNFWARNNVATGGVFAGYATTQDLNAVSGAVLAAAMTYTDDATNAVRTPITAEIDGATNATTIAAYLSMTNAVAAHTNQIGPDAHGLGVLSTGTWEQVAAMDTAATNGAIADAASRDIAATNAAAQTAAAKDLAATNALMADVLAQGYCPTGSVPTWEADTLQTVVNRGNASTNLGSPMIFSASPFAIYASTTLGADTAQVQIGAGGAVGAAAEDRGAWMELYGVDSGNGGDFYIYAASPGGEIFLVGIVDLGAATVTNLTLGADTDLPAAQLTGNIDYARMTNAGVITNVTVTLIESNAYLVVQTGPSAVTVYVETNEAAAAGGAGGDWWTNAPSSAHAIATNDYTAGYALLASDGGTNFYWGTPTATDTSGVNSITYDGVYIEETGDATDSAPDLTAAAKASLARADVSYTQGMQIAGADLNAAYTNGEIIAVADLPAAAVTNLSTGTTLYNLNFGSTFATNVARIVMTNNWVISVDVQGFVFTVNGTNIFLRPN